MNDKLKNALIQAIELYRLRLIQKTQSRKINEDFDKRLQNVIDNAESYVPSSTDKDINAAIENTMRLVNYHNLSQETMESLNQIYYMAHDCYSNNFYEYAASRRR